MMSLAEIEHGFVEVDCGGSFARKNCRRQGQHDGYGEEGEHRLG